MPEYDAVLAVNAGTGDMQLEMNTVWDNVIPAFNAAPLPEDPEGDKKLADKLAGLRLPAQAGGATSPLSAKVAGRHYLFPSNPSGIESLTYEPGKEGSGDAFVIRMVLVPALMALMGPRAWWLPRGLDRKLPRLNVDPALHDVAVDPV